MSDIFNFSSFGYLVTNDPGQKIITHRCRAIGIIVRVVLLLSMNLCVLCMKCLRLVHLFDFVGCQTCGTVVIDNFGFESRFQFLRSQIRNLWIQLLNALKQKFKNARPAQYNLSIKCKCNGRRKHSKQNYYGKRIYIYAIYIVDLVTQINKHRFAMNISNAILN